MNQPFLHQWVNIQTIQDINVLHKIRSTCLMKSLYCVIFNTHFISQLYFFFLYASKSTIGFHSDEITNIKEMSIAIFFNILLLYDFATFFFISCHLWKLILFVYPFCIFPCCWQPEGKKSMHYDSLLKVWIESLKTFQTHFVNYQVNRGFEKLKSFKL